MYGIVYLVHNKINGKNYVGLTIGNLFKRMSDHYTVARIHKDNNYFMRALRKYKKIDWEWRVLQEAVDKEHLNMLEDYWGRFFKVMIPNGYNTRGFGSYGKHIKETKEKISELLKGNKNHLGCRHTKETKQKMSKTRKGKIFTKEHCENMSESRKGKKHTEETCNKISIANKDKKRSEETCKNMSEARKGNTCRKGTQTSKKARKNMSEGQKGKILTKETREKMSKTIKCMETGERYNSITEAARETGICLSNISRVGLGKRKTAGGFQWRLV